jgi:hypothetical protein
MSEYTDDEMKKMLQAWMPPGAPAEAKSESASARGSAQSFGGTEAWNVTARGGVRECSTIENVIEEVRESLEMRCGTITVERKGAPNSKVSDGGGL